MPPPRRPGRGTAAPAARRRPPRAGAAPPATRRPARSRTRRRPRARACSPSAARSSRRSRRTSRGADRRTQGRPTPISPRSPARSSGAVSVSSSPSGVKTATPSRRLSGNGSSSSPTVAARSITIRDSTGSSCPSNTSVSEPRPSSDIESHGDDGDVLDRGRPQHLTRRSRRQVGGDARDAQPHAVARAEGRVVTADGGGGFVVHGEPRHATTGRGVGECRCRWVPAARGRLHPPCPGRNPLKPPADRPLQTLYVDDGTWLQPRDGAAGAAPSRAARLQPPAAPPARDADAPGRTTSGSAVAAYAAVATLRRLEDLEGVVVAVLLGPEHAPAVVERVRARLPSSRPREGSPFETWIPVISLSPLLMKPYRRALQARSRSWQMRRGPRPRNRTRRRRGAERRTGVEREAPSRAPSAAPCGRRRRRPRPRATGVPVQERRCCRGPCGRRRR